MQNKKYSISLIVSLVFIIVGGLLTAISRTVGIVKQNNIEQKQQADLEYCQNLSKIGEAFSRKYSEAKDSDDLYDLVITKLNEKPELAPLKVFIYTTMNNGSDREKVGYFINIECLHHGKEKYLHFLKERLIKQSEKEHAKEISQ